MMATILNSSMPILDSAILHKTLTQTSSIWLKLIHSDSTWWWQPSWILPSWIQTCHLGFKKTSLILLTQIDDGSHLEFCHLGFASHFAQNSEKLLQFFILTQLDDGSHLEFSILDSAILHKKKLVQSHFILTQLDDGSHLEFCHLGFRHAILDSNTLLSSLRFTQKHSHSFTLTDSN